MFNCFLKKLLCFIIVIKFVNIDAAISGMLKKKKGICIKIRFHFKFIRFITLL